MCTEQALTDRHYIESEGLCELLPWYVNRTLNEAESRTMDRHLRHCQACAEELPVLCAVRESMHNESVAVLAPKPDAEQFLANATHHRFRPQLRTTAWLAGAVAASIATLAVVLSWVQTDDSTTTPAVFETATNAGSGKTFDYVLLIAFDQEVEPQAHNEALEALAPVSIAGPDSVGNYRVVIRLPARSLDELQDFTRKIESGSVISSAEVVAVELPVESR